MPRNIPMHQRGHGRRTLLANVNIDVNDTGFKIFKTFLQIFYEKGKTHF